MEKQISGNDLENVQKSQVNFGGSRRRLDRAHIEEWGILTPYPEAEWVFSPESIMPRGP